MKEQVDNKFNFLFDVVRKNMGFVPNSMIAMAEVPPILASFTTLTGLLLGDPTKTSPLAILRLTFKNIFWSARYMKKQDRVPLPLRNMVAHITSKAAGCQYCQAHTIGSAKINGVSEEKLNSIWEFETSDHFSESERAALRFALAAGSHPNAVSEMHMTELKKYFTREQIIELGAVVSIFGFLNRWNETFATELESEAYEHAEKYLSNKGWSPGRHKRD